MTVEGWDGRGLPPVARSRIERAKADGVRTSFLPTGGLAGLEVAGFETVGEVLGTAVMQIGWTGYGGCGYYGNGYGGYGVGLSGVRSGWSGFEPYVRAVKHGRDLALDRMRQEATALGADGVVGVQFTDVYMEGQKREFMALGTAIRSRGRQRPAKAFTTDLGGQDVAKLLSAGYVPVGFTYGLAVVIRHDDWRTRQQVSVWSGNVEVTGYTDLLNQSRDQARHDFATKAAKLGADAALLSGLRTHVRELEPGENHIDHAAETLVTGNAIAKFHAGDRPTTGSLKIMPLSRRGIRK